MATAGADIVARMILNTGNVTSGVASMSSKLKAEAEGIATSNAKIGSSAKKAANDVNQSSLAANKMSYSWGTMFKGAEGSMSGFFGRMDSGNTKLSLLERTSSRVSGVMGTLKTKITGAASAIGNMDMMSSMLLAGAGLGILAFFAKATQAAGDFQDQWTTFGITMGKTGSDTNSIMSQWGSTYQNIQNTTGRSQTDIMTGLDKLSIAGVKSTGLMTESMDDLGGAAFQTHSSMDTLETAFQRNVQSTGLQQRSLKALGINMSDLSKVSGLTAAQITKNWKTMTTSQKASLLDSAMEMKDGQSANEKYKESYQGLLQAAKNAFQGIEIAVGNTILPILVPALKTAASLIKGLGQGFAGLPTPIKDVVVAAGLLAGAFLTIGGMAAILKPILTPLKAIGSTIQTVGGYVKSGISAIAKYIAELDLIPSAKETVITQKTVSEGGTVTNEGKTVVEDEGESESSLLEKLGLGGLVGGNILSSIGGLATPLIGSATIGGIGALGGYLGENLGKGGGLGQNAIDWASQLTNLLPGGLGASSLVGMQAGGRKTSGLDLALASIPGANLVRTEQGAVWNALPKGVTGYVGGAYDNTKNYIGGMLGNTQSYFGGLSNDLTGAINGNGAWIGRIGTRLSSIGSGITDYLGGAVGNTGKAFSGTGAYINGAVGNTSKALGGVGSWISGGLGSMFGGASAADGKSKPSMMSDIFGKNGLLDFSRFGVKWPKFKLPDLSGLWTSISGDASDAFNTIKGAWNNTTKWFSNGVKTVKSDFKGASSYIEGAWDNTEKDLSNGVKNIEKWFGSTWKDIQMGWNTLTKSIHNVWTSLISTLKNGANTLRTDVELTWKDIQNAFYSAVKGITNAWNTMKHLIDMGVSGVIHVGAGAISSAYSGALRLYNYVRNGVYGAIRIGTSALSNAYNYARNVWRAIEGWFSGVLHLNISGPGNGGGVISRIENDAMGVFNTLQSNPTVKKIENGAKWVWNHIFGPRKIRGPDHKGKIDSLKETMSGFRYQDYANHKKSIGQVLKDKSGNCFDLTLAGMAVGNALGLPSSMKLGTWNGGGHAYGNFDGENLDFARKALDNTYSPPVSGPKRDFDKNINVNINFINSTVYSGDEFEETVKETAKKGTIEVLNKYLK